MKVQAIPAWSTATLISLGAQQPTGRVPWVGCSASANISLVVGQRLQQPLVGVDKGLLFGRVELARHRLGLAMFQSQTMQQRNQPGTALADNPELVFDPRSGSSAARCCRPTPSASPAAPGSTGRRDPRT